MLYSNRLISFHFSFPPGLWPVVWPFVGPVFGFLFTVHSISGFFFDVKGVFKKISGFFFSPFYVQISVHLCTTLGPRWHTTGGIWKRAGAHLTSSERENAKKIKKTLDKIKPDAYNECQKEVIGMAEPVFSSAALKEVMRRQGVTNADMSKRMNVTPQTMYERLAKDNMKVNNFCEMARVLGMKVMLVPNDKPVRAGEFEIK